MSFHPSIYIFLKDVTNLFSKFIDYNIFIENGLYALKGKKSIHILSGDLFVDKNLILYVVIIWKKIG